MPGVNLLERAREALAKAGGAVLKDLEVPVGDWHWKCGTPSQSPTAGGRAGGDDSRRPLCTISINYAQIDDDDIADSDDNIADSDSDEGVASGDRTHRTPFRVAVQNQPGHWDAMISYTQRNAHAKLLAEGLYNSFRERGKTVWLDVKMDQVNASAMKEAAQNSSCVIAVVTGVEREGDPEDTAYFKRDYCMDELRWARQASVPIQPVIRREDKDNIGIFLGQAPEDLRQYLQGRDFKALDRISNRIWLTCIDEVLIAVRLTGAQAHGAIRDDATDVPRSGRTSKLPAANHVFAATNRWEQHMECEVYSVSGEGWCSGVVTATSSDAKTGVRSVTVCYLAPSGQRCEKTLPHDSAYIRPASSCPASRRM